MTIHKPVLLEEAIESLKLKKGDIVVDATLGGGGHSCNILKKIGDSGVLVAIDQDADAIKKFKTGRNIYLINDNFRNLGSILKNLRIEKVNPHTNSGSELGTRKKDEIGVRVNAVLADLGVSSDQLEKTERGFSFQNNGPLDMRMNIDGNLTAEKIINSYSEKELARIFKEYGDEKYARAIARGIVKQRKTKLVRTTFDLVSILENLIPEKYRHKKIHFATRIFQALRIEVNQELGSLKEFIPRAIEILNKKGRLAIITFHSGEDRIVKEIFRENARGCICPSNFPVCRCGKKPRVKIIAKKPILPSEGEIKNNPRSRSAKLRIIEKI